MFTSGRYIVIDDDLTHLRALVEGLHRAGVPAIGMQYDPKNGVNGSLFSRARVLFLDLHLIDGITATSDNKIAFNIIVDLLETGIVPDSGPYIIVLWTMHPEKRNEFERYLFDRLTPIKRPISVLHLSKANYFTKDAVDAIKLQKDVVESVTNDPRLHAMLKWEHDVLAAAGATLSALSDLIPHVDRVPERYGEHLDKLLSVLACAAAGKSHAKEDTRAAVGEALLPLLNDRLRNQVSANDDSDLWKRAATKIDEGSSLPTAEAARLNTMLHLALPPSEKCTPTDWGAIVLIPEPALADQQMLARFDMKLPQLRYQASAVSTSSEDRALCTPVLVRIGAACDYAQSRKGPIPYIFGSIVPIDVAQRNPIKQPSISPAIKSSPVCEIPGIGQFELRIDARCQITMTSGDLAGWETVCRIREQLLMEIVSHCSGHAARPGKVYISTPDAASTPAPEIVAAPAETISPPKAAAAPPENPAE